jgi:hypothetical protein
LPLVGCLGRLSRFLLSLIHENRSRARQSRSFAPEIHRSIRAHAPPPPTTAVGGRSRRAGASAALFTSAAAPRWRRPYSSGARNPTLRQPPLPSPCQSRSPRRPRRGSIRALCWGHHHHGRCEEGLHLQQGRFPRDVAERSSAANSAIVRRRKIYTHISIRTTKANSISALKKTLWGRGSEKRMPFPVYARLIATADMYTIRSVPAKKCQ